MIERRNGDAILDRDKDAFFDRACDVIIAFLNKNEVKPSDLPGIMREVHATLQTLLSETNVRRSSPANAATSRNFEPAVDVSESITPDYIVCLEDGKRLKTLKRYISGRFGLSPEQYRAKWGLAENYPMVAPNYAAKRSKLAKEFRLGLSRKKKRKQSARG